MKFSICTPVTLDKDHIDNLRMPRYEMFLRCANSVFGQTFDDFEWIIADDISNPPIEEILEKHDSWWKPRGLKVKIVRLKEKSGRITARNAAMEAASGDWLCWLDADDEYSSVYLQAINDATRIYPEYKIFNFDHLIFHYKYDVSIRKFIDMGIQGDTPFGSGVVGAGSFVFHRDVYKEIGSIPDKGLWDFAECAFKEFPEIREFFVKARDDEGNPTQWNTLGNPWGEDYYYFYKMTRKFKSKHLDTALYYVHSRWGHRWPEDPDYVVDPGKIPQWNKTNQ